MAKKITYLLGAGASANTIPVVAFMHERIEEVIEFLKACLFGTSKAIEPVELSNEKIITIKAIIEDLELLIKEAGNYYTIDTLAKKYYLTGEIGKLKSLKKSLIIYFTIEQLLNIRSRVTHNEGEYFKKENIDKRYSSFIAAITKKKYPIAGSNPDGLAAENLDFEISKLIKILSWNYDVQFELSLQSFTGTILQHIKTNFKILPNSESKNEVNNISIDSNSFGMVKLNGDAVWNKLFKQDFKHTIFDGKKSVANGELLTDFLEGYKTGNIERGLSDHTDISPLNCFNFAWENDNNFYDKYRGHGKNLEAAEKIAEQTEILVVIGYSFPIFNREIDNRLFSKMENLKKVYIQDKQPEKIKSTMQNAFEILQRKMQVGMANDYEIKEEYLVKFHLDDNTNQFVIPYELNQD